MEGKFMCVVTQNFPSIIMEGKFYVLPKQSCQLTRILCETHAFRHNLTLTRIITSISRAEYYYPSRTQFTLGLEPQTFRSGLCLAAPIIL